MSQSYLRKRATCLGFEHTTKHVNWKALVPPALTEPSDETTVPSKDLPTIHLSPLPEAPSQALPGFLAHKNYEIMFIGLTAAA